MKNIKSDFESIIPTALHTIYPLIYTDIPYVKEIFNELCKNGFPEELKNDKLVYEIEARYKLIDSILDKTNITQILELACGFTPRGLNYCLKNQDIIYVELDLQKVIARKQEIFNNIVEIPKNQHFVAGNALNIRDLKKCLKYFDLSKPIAIINQGFMRYLDFDEKRLLSSNVYNLIEPNNGVWLTCDFTPAAFIKNQDKNLSDGNNYNKNLTTVTYRNNVSWRFKDKEEVEKFVRQMNLNIEWHEFIESISMLSSLNILKRTKKEVEPYLKDAYVSILTANKNK